MASRKKKQEKSFVPDPFLEGIMNRRSRLNDERSEPVCPKHGGLLQLRGLSVHGGEQADNSSGDVVLHIESSDQLHNISHEDAKKLRDWLNEYLNG